MTYIAPIFSTLEKVYHHDSSNNRGIKLGLIGHRLRTSIWLPFQMQLLFKKNDISHWSKHPFLVLIVNQLKNNSILAQKCSLKISRNWAIWIYAPKYIEFWDNICRFILLLGFTRIFDIKIYFVEWKVAWV